MTSSSSSLSYFCCVMELEIPLGHIQQIVSLVFATIGSGRTPLGETWTLTTSSFDSTTTVIRKGSPNPMLKEQVFRWWHFYHISLLFFCRFYHLIYIKKCLIFSFQGKMLQITNASNYKRLYKCSETLTNIKNNNKPILSEYSIFWRFQGV